MKSGLNPKWRIWLFLMAANAAWMAAAWLWVERETWLWIIPIALSINFVLMTYDQVIHFRALVGHPMVGQDSWGILKIINELCERMHVPRPKVFLIPRRNAQIFSYGKSSAGGRLFITQGIIELLTPKQMRAALTFQIITIRSSYNVLNYWVAAVLDLVYRAGKAWERVCTLIFGWSPPLSTWLVCPWIWFMHVFLLGAADFHRLDLETARTLENPEDLAQVLWKIDAYAQTRPWNEPWIFAHMCMVSPLRAGGHFAGLRVQPALQDRIKNLIGRFPL